MRTSLLALLFTCWFCATMAQTSMPRDTSIIKAWASTCTVTRGWQDVAQQGLGTVSYGADTAGIGSNYDVVSLGDGGSAILTFSPALTDGPGPDLVVFENGFPSGGGIYAELAFVEVSSDGITYHRFPAHYPLQADTQVGPYEVSRGLEQCRNLSGTVAAPRGVAFDFSELNGAAGLNLSAITHVRIVDVVGSINPVWGSRDANGRLINDPYPTAFASGGFDLDAVAGIHPQTTGLRDTEESKPSIRVAPQPGTDHVVLSGLVAGEHYRIVDALGKVCHSFYAADAHHSLTKAEVGDISSVCWLFCNSIQNKQRAVKLFWR